MRKRVLHLGNCIVFQDDNQLAVLFRLLQPLRLAAIVIFECDDGIGITLVVRDDNRYAQLAGRFCQAVTVHAERIDAQCLHDRHRLFHLSGLVDTLRKWIAFSGQQGCGTLVFHVRRRRPCRRQGANLRLGLALSATAEAFVAAAITEPLLARSHLAKLTPFSAAATGTVKVSPWPSLAWINGAAKAANTPGRYLHTASRDATNRDLACLFIASAFLGRDSMTA